VARYLGQFQEVLTGVFGETAKTEIFAGMDMLEHEALAILKRSLLHLLNDIVILRHFKLELVDDPYRVFLSELLIAVLAVLLPEDLLHLPLELELDGRQHGKQAGRNVDHIVE
jgi:hypothetical protein